MTTLREDWLRIVKPDGKKIRVNGFSGVGALLDNGGNHVLVIAANEDVLFEMLLEFMPDADLQGIDFQKVTAIQTLS